jgi:predicted ATP-grasp superfamily ATP-dependent carboligase
MASNIVYIARDIERAMGKAPVGDYFIVTNTTPYAKEIKSKYPDNVFLINSEELLDTHELLLNIEVTSIIEKLNAKILVFKNTLNIENICKEKGWILLNPSAQLSEKIENKITQVSWLADLSSLLPPHSISQVKDIKWNSKVMILQWSHGHTGDGTLLIKSEEDLNIIKTKFPDRDARVTDFIKGPMFTINIVVTDTNILLGNISYQITGILPFTNNIFSTIGNDWAVPFTILSEKQISDVEDISLKVAKKMQDEKWRGLFGIDVIYDEERDLIYLIEINARQPASTTYESELQTNVRMHNVPGLTVFEAHLNALLDNPITLPIIPINDGAQILQRVIDPTVAFDSNRLVEAGYKVIVYNNHKPNSDLARIQSTRGIMETHTKFNKNGKQIIDLIV